MMDVTRLRFVTIVRLVTHGSAVEAYDTGSARNVATLTLHAQRSIRFILLVILYFFLCALAAALGLVVVSALLTFPRRKSQPSAAT